MTNLPSLPIASSRRSTIALLFAVLTCALLWLAAPARAVVAEVVPGTNLGITPRSTSLGEGAAAEGKGTLFTNESGNAVLHGTNVYPIFWAPENAYKHEWLVKVDQFFQNLGASSGSLGTIFASLGQYRDRTNTGAEYNTVYHGSYSDFTKYPSAGCTDPNALELGAVTCLTDAQLREQLQSFIASHGLPKGMNSVYYLMTPPGVTVCADAAATHCSDFTLTAEEEAERKQESTSYKHSFCSYHGVINPDNATEGDANAILYAAVPWTAGYAGLAGDSAFAPKHWLTDKPAFVQAYTCQDGGWNPEGHKENYEEPKERNEAEKTAFTKADPEEKEELEEARELEGPHDQEPNQEVEGRGEDGDLGPGLADLIIGQIAVEQANIVTDPMLNGWQDTTHHEVMDECRDAFASTAGPEGGTIEGSAAAKDTGAGNLSNELLIAGRYYINNSFSLSQDRCVGGVGIVPRFTAPNPVNTGEIVGFDGMESTVGLIEGKAFGPSGPPTVTYATYSWNFGDGTSEVKGYAPGSPPCELPWLSPCAGSIFHAYTYGGEYEVTLTITDVAGNVSSVTHELFVNGPPAPAPAVAGAGTNSSSSTGSGKTSAPIVNPVAAAAVLSRSLKTALRRGLTVRYSVNEEVAGNFEVLMSRAQAKKLGLHGTAVSGLPAGTPPQVMIARSVLVTTKAGANSIRIKFSGHVAARLKHAHRISILLRMFVRNAASKSPATTTVLSSVILSG